MATSNLAQPDKVEVDRRTIMDALSMLSLLRHRGGVRWGVAGLPYENEADEVIGRLERATGQIERGEIVPDERAR